MKISGLQKLTLLDYPGHLAAIVFLSGCNFRCPFCQNGPLVLPSQDAPSAGEEEFFRFLQKRSGILEGVCVTGGEPTLSPELPAFLKRIKDAGYLVKLDTNGSNPEMLETLLKDGLLDYAAMDLKAGRSNYGRVCGWNASAESAMLEKISRSVTLLVNSRIAYEFRTTVVQGLHTANDFEDIASWIFGCPKYFLQSFRDCPEILLKNHTFSAFDHDTMEEFLKIVRKKIPQASLRD